MRIPRDHPLFQTLALRRPETATAAAQFLRGASGTAEVEGLVELIYCSEHATPMLAAIAALAEGDRPIITDALLHALASVHNSVRLAAVQALHQRRARGAVPAWVRLLRRDTAWMVRRAALKALAE